MRGAAEILTCLRFVGCAKGAIGHALAALQIAPGLIERAYQPPYLNFRQVSARTTSVCTLTRAHVWIRLVEFASTTWRRYVRTCHLTDVFDSPQLHDSPQSPPTPRSGSVWVYESDFATSSPARLHTSVFGDCNHLEGRT